MKVFSITVALFLAVVVAPVAAAQPEPTTIDRIIAQEQAKGLLDTGPAGPIAAQEQGRRTDPRLIGSVTSPVPAVTVEQSGGFDWGDAGIGAAGASRSPCSRSALSRSRASAGGARASGRARRSSTLSGITWRAAGEPAACLFRRAAVLLAGRCCG